MVALERDVNGACYGVFPECPLMDLPNANGPIFYAYAFLGQTVGQKLGLDVIGPKHLAITLALLLLFLILLANFVGLI